jgi:hypothetical protein
MTRLKIAVIAAFAFQGPLLAAPEKLSPSFIGTHFHRAGQVPYTIDSSVGAIRLWDGSVSWRNIEPNRGGWVFEALDRAVEGANQAGLDVLYPLGLTPPWASSVPSRPSAYALGNSAPPRDFQDWDRYVATVARRYRGRISAYEIWNEPNRERFFAGTLPELIELTCRAHRIIKAIDPDALIVSSAPTGQAEGVQWLEAYLDSPARGCIDVVGIHLYTLAHEPPEAVVPLAKQLSALLQKVGMPTARVWNTEFGWFIANKQSANSPRYRVLPDEVARDYLLRSFLLQAALGVERAYQYSWNHGYMGVVEPGTGVEKNVVDAFRAASRWLKQASSVKCEQQAEVYRCQIERFGKRTVATWSTGNIALLGAEDARGFDWIEQVDGAKKKISGNTVPLGPSPILLSAD